MLDKSSICKTVWSVRVLLVCFSISLPQPLGQWLEARQWPDPSKPSGAEDDLPQIQMKTEISSLLFCTIPRLCQMVDESLPSTQLRCGCNAPQPDAGQMWPWAVVETGGHPSFKPPLHRALCDMFTCRHGMFQASQVTVVPCKRPIWGWCPPGFYRSWVPAWESAHPVTPSQGAEMEGWICSCTIHVRGYHQGKTQELLGQGH